MEATTTDPNDPQDLGCEILKCTGLTKTNHESLDHFGFRTCLKLTGSHQTTSQADLKLVRQDISHAVASDLTALYPSIMTEVLPGAETGSLEEIDEEEIERRTRTTTEGCTTALNDIEPIDARWTDGDRVYSFTLELNNEQKEKIARAKFVFDWQEGAGDGEDTGGSAWLSAVSKAKRIAAIAGLHAVTWLAARAAPPGATALGMWAATASTDILLTAQGLNTSLFLIRPRKELLPELDERAHSGISPRVQAQLLSLVPQASPPDSAGYDT